MDLEKCQTIQELHETLLDGFDKEPLKSYYLQALQRAYTLGMLKGAELMQEAAVKTVGYVYDMSVEHRYELFRHDLVDAVEDIPPADVIKPQGKTDM